MRIAALIYLAPRKLGSLEQWLMGFAAECTRRGHRVHLFCAKPFHPVVEKRLADLGVPWTPFEVLERQPFRWSRKLKRSFDLIYMNLVVPRSWGAYAGYLAWPLPILFFDGISGSMPGRRATSRLGRILDPLLFSRVTSLAVCSQYVLKRDLWRFRLDPARCKVFYNGIDTSRFVPGRRAAAQPPQITAVARLIPEKGIDILIEACVSLQDLPWRLAIVGDGVEQARLESLAASVGLAARTRFLGLRDDVEALLQDADIYVHPCLWEEAFGLTIAEAMACGCATVASRVGGIPEIIEDGRSGVLVQRGDVAELAQALRELLTDPMRRTNLGLEARQRAVDRFDLRPAVTDQVDWIEEWGRRANGKRQGTGR